MKTIAPINKRLEEGDIMMGWTAVGVSMPILLILTHESNSVKKINGISEWLPGPLRIGLRVVFRQPT
ncbi:MAG: hypothetical protein WD738_18615 [Pirellulales bacterium]